MNDSHLIVLTRKITEAIAQLNRYIENGIQEESGNNRCTVCGAEVDCNIAFVEKDNQGQ